MQEVTVNPPPPEDEATAHPVVLFDGVCNLCNSVVQWLVERDPEGRLRFASLQSRSARRALAAAEWTMPRSSQTA